MRTKKQRKKNNCSPAAEAADRKRGDEWTEGRFFIKAERARL
jgi:hypothetical protein